MSSKLGKTGSAIWAAYQADRLDAPAQALVREFARCADALDRLDDLVRGKRDAWASLVFDDMGEVHLSIDKLMDERIKHQLALKQIHGEIRQAGIKPGTVEQPEVKDEEPEDMLTRRRREREERERKLG